MTEAPPISWSKNPAFAPAPWHPTFTIGEPLHPVQIAGYKRMSPAQKLDMMVAMYRSGIALRVAGLRLRHPDWTPDQLELEARRGLLHART